ncbi:hypothetical protein NLI96_g6836 [Meripilus lineatus]|uniref:B30.2/SPRY domain-containing protein n=1 Tax=Meripilus lineatus TaxID=2056292 RepID=A0AAD5YHR3_9APHY|nr:hypothetical protein NLI96_g6836 [Physisporinus lineatus]
MEVVSSRDQSPALLAVPPTNTTHNHRKRKHAAAASVAASSPAPSSDRGDTPAPSTDNVSVPGRNDLATRPRLKISRHPSFVPIAPGSPYHTTELLCVNKLKFRYTPAGLSPEGATLPFRTIESAPQTFRVSWEDRSPFVKVTQDGLGLKGERGFRSARCNAPVREGKWYMEVKIDLGGGEIPPEWKKSEGGHVRLGWGRRESPLNGPAGSDGYSYAMRDKTGEKVHLSRPRPYGKPFKTGDVVGMYISLPPHREPNPKDPHDPAHIKRERIAIDVKSQEYFESYEYAQSEEMMALMEVNKTVPAPITTKKSATVKNLPSTSRGPQNTVPETPASRPLPTLGPDSYVAFFVNGECQGIAYQDLYDYLPLRTLRKAQEKKRSHREGVREHKENPFDDGSLGYYPLISLFNEARVKLNPGPDFEFPPPSDIDGLLTLNSSMDVDVKPGMTEHARTWRPLCERYPEYMAEQFALDAQEEEEATTQQQMGESQAQLEAEEAEKRREKRRAQAAARKERKQKEKEEAAAQAREAKRRKLESASVANEFLHVAMDYDERPPELRLPIEPPILEGLADHVNSPAPTVASSAWAGGGHDTSEYNTEFEDVNEVEEGDPDARRHLTDELEDELAAAAGVDRIP